MAIICHSEKEFYDDEESIGFMFPGSFAIAQDDNNTPKILRYAQNDF